MLRGSRPVLEARGGEIPTHLKIPLPLGRSNRSNRTAVPFSSDVPARKLYFGSGALL